MTVVCHFPVCTRRNNQYFIYVMEEQDSVFGTELVAREVPVTVLDKNEQYVAVEEVISGEVIVSSDKDIAEEAG